MSGEAAKVHVTSVPSTSWLVTYFCFSDVQYMLCGLPPTLRMGNVAELHSTDVQEEWVSNEERRLQKKEVVEL